VEQWFAPKIWARPRLLWTVRYWARRGEFFFHQPRTMDHSGRLAALWFRSILWFLPLGFVTAELFYQITGIDKENLLEHSLFILGGSLLCATLITVPVMGFIKRKNKQAKFAVACSGVPVGVYVTWRMTYTLLWKFSLLAATAKLIIMGLEYCFAIGVVTTVIRIVLWIALIGYLGVWGYTFKDRFYQGLRKITIETEGEWLKKAMAGSITANATVSTELDECLQRYRRLLELSSIVDTAYCKHARLDILNCPTMQAEYDYTFHFESDELIPSTSNYQQKAKLLSYLKMVEQFHPSCLNPASIALLKESRGSNR